jgi:hypothetical protein
VTCDEKKIGKKNAKKNWIVHTEKAMCSDGLNGDCLGHEGSKNCDGDRDKSLPIDTMNEETKSRQQ